jgi:hypothetical protein
MEEWRRDNAETLDWMDRAGGVGLRRVRDIGRGACSRSAARLLASATDRYQPRAIHNSAANADELPDADPTANADRSINRHAVDRCAD